MNLCLFDAAAGNFYPAAGSRIIDSSLDSLPDRPNMITVRQPLGIPLSPILRSLDLFGQLRSDDPSVSPPSGFDTNTFKDRGAVDRVDFAPPTASLISPLDNESGVDLNSALNDVTVAIVRDVSYPSFTVQLTDVGAGIANSTVTSDTVQVFQDGVLLTPDKDYFFSYNPMNGQIKLFSAGGAWAPNSTYKITLSDDIRDVADNPILPNRADETTSFFITLAGFDFGDAPMYMDPGHTVSATSLPNGARHLVIPGISLGLLNSTEQDARIDGTATGDPSDDGVTFQDGAFVISRDVRQNPPRRPSLSPPRRPASSTPGSIGTTTAFGILLPRSWRLPIPPALP